VAFLFRASCERSFGSRSYPAWEAMEPVERIAHPLYGRRVPYTALKHLLTSSTMIVTIRSCHRSVMGPCLRRATIMGSYENTTAFSTPVRIFGVNGLMRAQMLRVIADCLDIGGLTFFEFGQSHVVCASSKCCRVARLLVRRSTRAWGWVCSPGNEW
jgi:hypothetical protein